MTTSHQAPDRRGFLKGSLLIGAAATVPAAPASAQSAKLVSAGMPTAQLAQAEAGPVEAGDDLEAQVRNAGSDFMVDLLKAAGIDFVAAMPGSSFRGLQESIVNYGGNEKPEFIACLHEEVSAAMAHGYAKVAGKPMACLLHSNVGLQHASMAIYNAWCDRAPMMVLVGNSLDAATRRPWVEWTHSQTDLAAMVRDFVKWDDVPVSLQHYSESFMRGFEITMTPPYEPVVLVVDSDLQEHPIEDRSRLSIPKRAPVSPVGGEPAAVRRAAAMLLGATSPVIVADRAARTAAGLELVTQLAELLNAPVIDKGGRLNIATNHYLAQTYRQRELIRGADVVLGLELTDIFGVFNSMPDVPDRVARSVTGPGTKVIAISANYAYMKGNVQDMQRYYAADLTIGADAEACLPQLIEAVRSGLNPSLKAAIARRKAPLQRAFEEMRAEAANDAARSWDASPIGTGRMCMEIWDQIKVLDWALVSNVVLASSWPLRLWDITHHHQYIGGEGGYGLGYGPPAAAGAALAHRAAGRVPVAILGDGDMMVVPGTLWTLAHHRIPLLTVVHNNRAWHQETMHLQRMANRRNRGVERAPIGTLLNDPLIDYAQLARSMGVWAEGPISAPEALAPAIKRALNVVKAGEPALLDVVTQPR